MKTCKTCKESKDFTEFYKKAAAADGHQYHCKDCQKERQRTGGSLLEDTITPEQRKDVYTAVILRMRKQGLTSDVTTNEMLARVGDM